MPCADCFKGNDHPGPCNGAEESLYGHQVYVARPQGDHPRHKAVIVVFSDMFGWDTANLRRLADSYAERTGCVVYVPDFMHGTSAPAWMKRNLDQITGEWGFWAWMVKPWLVLKAALVLVPFVLRNSPEKRYPGILKFMDRLRCDQEQTTKVGVVGFCWGGYSATHLAHGGLASNGKTLIDAAFTAHPSELNLPDDISKIKLPWSMIVGDVDFALPVHGIQQAAEILDRKKEVPSEVVVIPNARHGFAVRGNLDNKAEVEMADQAEDQMVSWFAKYLY
ncbi:hypothetical protein N7499_004977 [Penicillium canescens]|uniref:Dienelactone hydrolase domain-containing protein n=1 Tax=Penicillium canescens TaxID=5083 RepID=A0AAD6I165_PENCN|nr:uncharacterized protein N7446_004527 [Penicillium canescens]KAJ6009626.1 hypothetical protein N7522_004642 [Penicillium canescens]KAJ6026873.1 hypothetical protein N7460_011690 [Penicillium canescens]KAJ6040156.1 hypothetical protein N7444_009061 [Penicillium canescens]KAJ6067490.1 hypothetical protein N7446_004527 [Penicillium canescens]KAJ6085348.1 hypothetical protein N7499_004977 [Penicillium canescens]